MITQEAYNKVIKYKNIRLKDIVPYTVVAELQNHKNGKGLNKGLLGLFFETIIGIKQSTRLRDFVDGEMKTIPMIGPNPKETVAIHQMTSANAIDDFLFKKFEETDIAKKMERMLLVFIDKTSSDAGEWYISAVLLMDLSKPKFAEIKQELHEEFNNIQDILNNLIKDGKMISSKGLNQKYSEVRTKASKRADGTYAPLFSNRYNRVVSNKGRAYYLKKALLKKLFEMATEQN